MSLCKEQQDHPEAEGLHIVIFYKRKTKILHKTVVFMQIAFFNSSNLQMICQKYFICENVCEQKVLTLATSGSEELERHGAMSHTGVSWGCNTDL